MLGSRKVLSALGCVLVVGCGDGSGHGASAVVESQPDAGGAGSGGAASGGSGGAPAVTGGGPSASGGTTVDAGRDASVDAAEDAARDAAPDASVDASLVDAGPEAAVVVEAGPEPTVEAGSEPTVEAGPPPAVDAAPDVSTADVADVAVLPGEPVFRCALLADLDPGPDYWSVDPMERLPVAGGLYFNGWGPEGIPSSFFTDGTRAGTVPLGGLSQYPSTVVSFFVAHQGSIFGRVGYDLVSVDGAVVTVRQPLPGGLGGVSFGTHLYFATTTDIVRTDGTSVEHLARPAELTSVYELLGVVGDGLLFSAQATSGAYELWRTDATGAAMSRVFPASDGLDLSPQDFYSVGARAFFVGNDGTDTWVLHVTDGTTAGTQIVGGVLQPELPLGEHGGTLGGDYYFSGQDASGAGLELYRVAAGSSTATLVKDIAPDGDSHPGGFLPYGGALYFGARPLASWMVNRLYRTDGTAAGTVMVYDQPSGNSWITNPVVLDGRLVFGVSGFNSEEGVVVSDGTTAGTRRRWVFQPNPANIFVPPVVASGGHAYFSADDGVHGREMHHCWYERLPTTPLPTCGNGVVDEGTEQCDGADLMGADCSSASGGYGPGTLGCTADCRFDLSGCRVCGNGKSDPGEACDGDDLGGATCATVAGDGATGTLACSPRCTLDATACVPAASHPSCGTPQACQRESCCTSLAVPGGAFRMGRGTGSDAYASFGELHDVPEHDAQLSSFYLDRYEVTVGRFREYVRAYAGPPAAGAGAHPKIAGSGWKTAWNGAMPADRDELYQQVRCMHGSYHEGRAGADSWPVTCLSWELAFAFCAWDGGRLPTDAEWEFAAAGGSEERLFPWGATEPFGTNAFLHTVCDTLDGGPCYEEAYEPVGSHPGGAGRWGHQDLSGSAEEWVLDLLSDAFYQSPCTDCANLSTGVEHVARSLTQQQTNGYRAAARSSTYAERAGVRCARDVP